ncbi:MAG: GNAT family N-acetyltransferase [Chloroflexi bacterium HGW-Chloroflexi-10]|nr:MAG: GNAT family N-acetyltransferase [Chloroflexi bacterium HGW-Chloroflexi-10]
MSIDSLFLTFPPLETPRLFLRRMQASDAEALFQVLSDDEVTQYYDDDTFTDSFQAREQIEVWENGYIHRRGIRWGIVRKEGGALIGSCGMYGIHPLHLRTSIGYELARPFWRQGLMTEALDASLALGFNAMGLNRIDAVVMPGNSASIKLLEKLGFCNEGLLREYEKWGSKGFKDVCMLSLLKRTWQQL